MLAGELPFDGDSVRDVLVQHVTKNPPHLKDVAQGTSDEVARAIGRCLAKDPADRWSDASQFSAAIRQEGVAATDLPVVLGRLDGFVAKGALTSGITLLAVPLLWYATDSRNVGDWVCGRSVSDNGQLV